jgi:Ca-activated chloride channel family protein
MDRDVVLLVTPQEARPQVLSWSQGVAVASFELPVAPKAEGTTGLALKLLVDCSGSMGGDSIASARRALMGVTAGLSEGNEVSLTRFGSDAELALAPQRCTPQVLERLGEAVEATDATLGGTEMEAALLGVFALPSWLPPAASSKARKGQDRAQAAQQAPSCADVLLITDGEVWDTKRMIASAQRSGHRVFVIGVGTSPAEAVLRHLAEATGGACEFATPGEALEAAAERMLQRMRQSVWTGLRVDWGMAEAPQWELPVQQRAFGGDTLLALGGFAAAGGPEATEGAESAPATGRLESSRGPVALGGPRDVRLLARGADGQEVEIGRVFPAGAQPDRRTKSDHDATDHDAIDHDDSVIAVLSTDGDGRREALGCGEVLSDVLMEATIAGLATCTLSHMTELEASRAIIRGLTGGAGDPQLLIRIGQVPALEDPPPPTPRRPLADVLTFR